MANRTDARGHATRFPAADRGRSQVLRGARQAGGILADGRVTDVFSRDLDVDRADSSCWSCSTAPAVPLMPDHPGMARAHTARAVLGALAAVLEDGELAVEMAG